LLTLAFDADGGLCMGVADDGRGFDPAALDRHLPAGRLGLLGMRERAELAGGRLTVRPAPGHGTIIKATFARNGREAGQMIPGRDLISEPEHQSGTLGCTKGDLRPWTGRLPDGAD
jgi:Histidine kinase-, DNA gyrase B-, and HSP90-like ATPase